MVCSYNGPIQSIALGVEEAAISEEQITVFPNPAESSFTVDLSVFKGANVTMELFDVLGKNVKSISGITDDRITVSREGIKNGMYLIRVTADGKQFSRKINIK
jgi:hypothetical protein